MYKMSLTPITTTSQNNAPKRKIWRLAARAALAASVMLGLLAVDGCSSTDDVEDLNEASATASIDDVQEDAKWLAGQRIEVRGEVAKQMDPCVFTVTADDDEMWPEPLLVMCATAPGSSVSAPAGLSEGVVVELAGEVVEFTRDAFERKSTVTVDEELFAKREVQPVLVAEAIKVAGESDAKD